MDLVHDTLSRQIAGILRQRILFSNQYRSGDQIFEADIARELKTSRAPIREAIRELETQGLLGSVPRKGTFVTKLDREDMLELYDVRVLLETRVYEVIVQGARIGAAEAGELRGIVDRMVAATRSGQPVDQVVLEFNRHDIDFHLRLWQISGRKWSVKLLTNLFYQLRLAMIQDLIMEQNLEASARIHYDILDALAARNLEAARRSLMQHIFIIRQQDEQS